MPAHRSKKSLRPTGESNHLPLRLYSPTDGPLLAVAVLMTFVSLRVGFVPITPMDFWRLWFENLPTQQTWPTLE